MGDHDFKGEEAEVEEEVAQATEEEKEKVKWPLSYQLRLPKDGTKIEFWSHALYFNADNKPVQVYYSRTLEYSEILARKFLDEPVLGFDMEWPMYANSSTRLQENVGLIQVACEDKIGLFHLGLHDGETPDEVIAPSLRKIIESRAILKTGVSVHRSDMTRLKKYFGLNPQGAFELSHLHRLVMYGGKKPHLVTTKIVSLSDLVETHLGFPLWKGRERTSDWSKPLDGKQKCYAAADAYAGYMLYMCLDAKRVDMEPEPSLPLVVEEYIRLGLGTGVMPLRLEKRNEEGTPMTANEFFGPGVTESEVGQETTGEKPGKETKKATKSRTVASPMAMDSTSRTLFNRLKLRRDRLADARKTKTYMGAHNCVLESLAILKPLDEAALRRIKGIGEKKMEQYGAEWLSEIRTFLGIEDVTTGEGGGNPEWQSQPDTDFTTVQQPATPRRPARRQRGAENLDEEAENSPPAFGSAVRRPPALHTGLSFALADSQLDGDSSISPEEEDSGVFMTPYSKPPSERKRKRPESSSRDYAPTTTDEPLSLESRLFRNKLDAYSKRIASMLQPRPQEPLVSEETLELIARRPPQTAQELELIPGIERLAAGCRQVGKDLLVAIMKYSRCG